MCWIHSGPTDCWNMLVYYCNLKDLGLQRDKKSCTRLLQCINISSSPSHTLSEEGGCVSLLIRRFGTFWTRFFSGVLFMVMSSNAAHTHELCVTPAESCWTAQTTKIHAPMCLVVLARSSWTDRHRGRTTQSVSSKYAHLFPGTVHFILQCDLTASIRCPFCLQVSCPEAVFLLTPQIWAEGEFTKCLSRKRSFFSPSVGKEILTKSESIKNCLKVFVSSF